MGLNDCSRSRNEKNFPTRNSKKNLAYKIGNGRDAARGGAGEQLPPQILEDQTAPPAAAAFPPAPPDF